MGLVVGAGRQLVPGAVRAVFVVVPLVGGQDVPGMFLIRDQDVVEDLSSDAADDVLAVGVHPRRLRCTMENLYLLGLVEGRAVLAVAITQQEAKGEQCSSPVDRPRVGT
jgi:hypothetical protein